MSSGYRIMPKVENHSTHILTLKSTKISGNESSFEARKVNEERNLIKTGWREGEITISGYLEEMKMSNPNQNRLMLCFQHETINNQFTNFFWNRAPYFLLIATYFSHILSTILGSRYFHDNI